MRIVCLITVGAFLLSIAMAEGEMPMGVQHYHQRIQRPIILEPVKKYNSNDEGSPLHWFFNAVSRAMEPPPKPAPRMIGPISVPGFGGPVYIKEVLNRLPWESNHVVIRLMTRDPVTGLTIPMDTSGVARNRLENSSRRLVKPHVYQPAGNHHGRANNAIQQGFVPSSIGTAQPSWPAQYRQQYSAPYSKPLRPNDFRYDNYQKEADPSFSRRQPDDFANRRPAGDNYENFQPISGAAHPEASESGASVASPSMYQPIAQKTPSPTDYSNDYSDQRFAEISKNSDRPGDHFYSTKPDSLRSTRMPYPEYPPLRDEAPRASLPRSIANETQNVDASAVNDFRGVPRYRSVVREDRMVPIVPKRRSNFVAPISRGRIAKESTILPNESATKFDSDVSGGIEVIAAPNLNRDWNAESGEIGKNRGYGRDSGGNSQETDTDVNQDEDSMSMGDGRNLARGESADHANEQPAIDDDKPAVTRRAQSRISSYSVIDRAHRSQGSQNLTSGPRERSDEESASTIGSAENQKNLSIERDNRTSNDTGAIGKIESKTRTNNATAEIARKLANLTSSRWRLTARRKPRIVKPIYRRKAKIGVIKSSRESSESTESSNEKNSSGSSNSD